MASFLSRWHFLAPALSKPMSLLQRYSVLDKRAGLEKLLEVKPVLSPGFRQILPCLALLLIQMGIACLCQHCLEESGDREGLKADLAEVC